MNLIVYFAAAADATARSRCGVVIVDAESAEPVREMSRDLASPPSSRAAVYEALLRGVEAAAALRPEEVEFRTATPWLIDQLTGLEAADDPLFQEIQAALLRLDLWRVAPAAGGGAKRAEELARG